MHLKDKFWNRRKFRNNQIKQAVEKMNSGNMITEPTQNAIFNYTESMWNNPKKPQRVYVNYIKSNNRDSGHAM